jgi:hypothetical protein
LTNLILFCALASFVSFYSALHRPRAPSTPGWKAGGEVLTVQWDEKASYCLFKFAPFLVPLLQRAVSAASR